MSYVYDNTSLNFPKSDFSPLPAGADATKWVRAEDWNSTNQAVQDIRSVLYSAKWYGLEEQVSAPSPPVGVSNYVYYLGGNKLFLSQGSPAVLYRALLMNLNLNRVLIGDGENFQLGLASGTKIGTSTSEKLGFWGAAPIAQPNVTGSRVGGAALANLLTALHNMGLIVDSTTA